MTQEQPPNQVLGVILGVLLLLGGHAIVLVLFFLVGLFVSVTGGGYLGIGLWVVGALFLFLWQLIYVIPLVLWFRRRRYWGLMKGVIIGAVLTALLNGTCYLSLFRTN